MLKLTQYQYPATFQERMARSQTRCTGCDAWAEAFFGEYDHPLCEDCFSENVALAKRINNPPLDLVDWALIWYGIAAASAFGWDVAKAVWVW